MLWSGFTSTISTSALNPGRKTPELVSPSTWAPYDEEFWITSSG